MSVIEVNNDFAIENIPMHDSTTNASYDATSRLPDFNKPVDSSFARLCRAHLPWFAGPLHGRNTEFEELGESGREAGSVSHSKSKQS